MNLFVVVLWIAATVLVVLRTFDMVKKPCSDAFFSVEQGFSACVLYKVLAIAAACGILSSSAVFALDVVMFRRQLSRGKTPQSLYDDAGSEYRSDRSWIAMQSTPTPGDGAATTIRRRSPEKVEVDDEYGSLYFGQVPMLEGSKQFVKRPAPEPVATSTGLKAVGNNESEATGFILVGNNNDDMPRIPVRLAGSIPLPISPQQPAAESNLPNTLDVDLPQFWDASSISIEPPDTEEMIKFRLAGLDEQEYKNKVLRGLDGTPQPEGMPSFVNYRENGYVLEKKDKKYETHGEGTYFTAIAAAAFALDSYQSPRSNTDEVLAGLFDVLINKSWGNTDSSNVKHPIRHPTVQEIHSSGVIRQRPMSKDAFGPIVAACYYTYNSPNTSWAIREMAKGLVVKWVEYLRTHNWTLHTNYLPGEFEKGPGKKYKNLRSYQEGLEPGLMSFLGPEAFLLLPCELYALKHCAESLSVPNSIAPWVNASFAIGANIPYHIAPLIVAAAHRALRYVLEHLKYEQRFSYELIRGWKYGTLKTKLSISISEEKKTAILNAFDKAVYEAVELVFQSPDSAGTPGHPSRHDIIQKVLPFFPDELLQLPLYDILQDLLAQVLPWFQDDLLFEYVAFQISYDPRLANELAFIVLPSVAGPGVGTYFGWQVGTAPTTAPKASDSGYIFWSMLIETETRPVLNCLLRPLASSHYSALKGGGNPIGLWAALSEDQSQIDRHIQYFMFLDGGKIPPDGKQTFTYDMKPYAWAKNYAEWQTTNTDPSSSRLDYLVLRALIDKGIPPRVPLSISSLRIFVDAAEALVRNMILLAVDEFKKTGKYSVIVVDASGAVVQDLVDASRGLIRNIWRGGEQTSQTLYKLAGQVEQWRWNPGKGFSGFTRWSNDPLEALSQASDLLEHRIRDLDGALRVWKWGEGMTFQAFSKYATSGVDGAFDEAQKIIQQARDLDGRLHQWISSQGQLRSYLGWVNATAAGQVAINNCVLHVVRDVTGDLQRWEYDTRHVLKNFNHWVTSNSLGNTDPSKLLQSAVRDPGGLLIQSIFVAGALQKELHWAASSVEGIGRATDCILVEVRGLDNAIEQWTIGGGGIKKYAKWANAASNGAAGSDALVKTVEKLSDGKIIINMYKAGQRTAERVTDGLGKVLSEGGKEILNQAEKPPQKLFSWVAKRAKGIGISF
ncbi:C2 domain containing protein [Purpureocillium lavendulum]|uniref:C2 domain containing protein n=1 Tax=Purpureocillium lavendulum TaxID=1247861 RepID=A0AB34G4B8_9HYPO|nr:C2 domain containing protein [Purpureocillium lavendulum]